MTAPSPVAEMLAELATMPAGERLRALDRAEPAIRGAMALTVAELRREGVTWAAIGEILGTTRQAAQIRFGRR